MRVKFFAVTMIATVFTLSSFASPSEPVDPGKKVRKGKSVALVAEKKVASATEKKALVDLTLFFTDPAGWSRTNPNPGTPCVGELKFCRIEITRVGPGGIEDDDQDITDELELQYNPANNPSGTTIRITVNGHQYDVTVYEKN